MSNTFSDKAIILKRTNFGEADRILSVLTENHGKISIRAKGVRKITAKLAGHVELLCLSELFLAQGKKFFVLAGAKGINMYARVREDFGKLETAFELVETVDRNMKEGDPHKNVFELLKSSLEHLARPPEAVEVTLQHELLKCDFNRNLLKPYFILNFLKCLGYEPQLRNCAHCHGNLNELTLSFSFAHGGLLCENCWQIDRDAFTVSVEAIKVLRLFVSGRVEIIDRFNLSRAQTAEVLDISSKLLMYRLEPPAKAERFGERMKVAENRV